MAILTKDQTGAFTTAQVEKGDTLSRIASMTGVPINNISGYRSGNPDLIYPGEVLRIGGGTPQTAQPNKIPSFVPQPQVNGQDPVTKFNMAVLDMLKQAQSGAGNEDLYKQRLGLQRAQLGRVSEITPEEQRNLSPSQQEAIRGGSAGSLSPEIDAVASKIKANDSRLQNFESILGQMRTIGMDVAKLNPSKEVMQGYKNMLEAGADPSSVPNEIIGQVSGLVDWNKWRTAKAALAQSSKAPNEGPSSYQEWSLAGGLKGTGKTYAEFLNSTQGLTNSTRTMLEAAPQVKNFVTKLQKEIEDAKNGLGPAASRWREFSAGKVGLRDPAFIEIRTNMGLLTTLLMRMHVGARGGEYIMKHFEDLLSYDNQNPENLQKALETVSSYADDLIRESKGQSSPSQTKPNSMKTPDGKIYDLQGDGTYKLR